MLRIRIDGVSATVVENETLTAGRRGLECAFEFAGGDWGDLLKVAVFEGVETVDVALEGGACIVPWESLDIEGVQLKVGVYGANGSGTIVIPTVWATVGKIQPSANPSGNEPDTPSQNLIAYAVETANDAKTIAVSVKDRADNGDFDGQDGADGSQLWKSSAAPTSGGGVYTFDSSNLSGDPNMSPAVGDVVFYSYYYYNVTSVSGTSVVCASRVSIRGSSGANGQGVPTGGAPGQVLKKQSGTDYDTYWDDESGGGGGTSDYDDLTDKPQINSVTLSGNKSTSDLGLDQVFWAVDGSTHNDPIHDAHAAGKIVLVEVSGRVYQMTEEVSSTKHRFTCADQGTVYWIEVSNDIWDADPTSRAIPVKATSTPTNLGTAAIGSSTKYAAENHVHENNIFAVTYTKTGATTATCNKTFADIVAAATAGKTVVAVLSGLFPATQTSEISIGSATSFKVIASVGGTGHITITHTSDNTISFSQVYGQEEITASGILKGNGAGGVSAAVAGTDYIASMPSAADVGAIAAPSSPASGQYLAWNGSAWVAQSLPIYNGGVS